MVRPNQLQVLPILQHLTTTLLVSGVTTGESSEFYEAVEAGDSLKSWYFTQMGVILQDVAVHALASSQAITISVHKNSRTECQRIKLGKLGQLD